MTWAVGDLATLVNSEPPLGILKTTWHCRITDLIGGGRAIVQQLTPAASGWKREASTAVDVAALRPCAVQLDLFGNPA